MELHIKKIKPLFTNILTTAERYQEDVLNGGIITGKNETQGSIKFYQTVVAVGPMVRGIEVGDQVMINPKKYEVKRYDPNSVKEDMGMNAVTGWNLPVVEMDDVAGNPQEYLFLDDRDIEFVFEGEEKKEEEKSSLIMPRKKTIITN
jgi:co-chaperonin GroES (HSP10)